MITLTCTKCQTVMEMDDAFAGGVCRCQHCGTIQTVPASLKKGARTGAPLKAGTQRALYSGGRGSGVPSSGLDDLANAVASSGLSSGLANQTGQRSKRPVEYARPGTGTAKPNRLPLIIGIVVAALAVAGAAAWFVVSPSTTTVTPNPTPGGLAVTTGGSGVIPAPGTGGSRNPAIAGPQFAGIPLGDHKKVVFVIDRGQSGVLTFDPLKVVLVDSVTSLGQQREFQVLFWTSPGSDDVEENAYPKGSLARGNAERVASLKRHLDDVSLLGSTEVGPALKAALARNPDAIVLTTAKGSALDDAFAKVIADARGTKTTAIHAVDLNSDGDGRKILEAVARSTGGHYVHVPPDKLK